VYCIIFVLIIRLHEISISDLPLYWEGKTQTQRKDTSTVNSCLKPAKEIENLQATHIAAKHGLNFLSCFPPGTDTQWVTKAIPLGYIG